MPSPGPWPKGEMEQLSRGLAPPPVCPHGAGPCCPGTLLLSAPYLTLRGQAHLSPPCSQMPDSCPASLGLPASPGATPAHWPPASLGPLSQCEDLEMDEARGGWQGVALS